MSQTETTTSAGIHWDLGPLFADDDAARAAIPALLDDCRAFRERYRGRVAGLEAPELGEALEELAAIDNRLSRLASYAGLRLTVNVSGEAERDLNAAVEMSLTEAMNALRFFQLEWIAVDDAHAERILADEALARDRHYLASARRFAPHTRSEPEEEMLAERDPAAAGAWHTLFDQVTSTLRVPFDGEDRTIDEVLARVRGPVREQRRGRLRGALHRARAADADPRPRLRLARGRPPRARPRTRLQASPRAARPRQRDPERGRGRPARGGRAPSPPRASLVPAQGEATRPREARAGRSVRAARRLPRSLLRRRDGARRERARRLLAAHRRCRSRPLPRQPHRRRAAQGQARRRVLRLDRTGRPAIHHAEFHGSDGRRAHARARDRPRDAVPAGRRAADGALAPPPTGARRSAVDVRRDDRRRPPAGGRGRRHAGASRAARSERRERVRDGLPADAHGALRAGRLQPARGGQGAHARPPRGGVAGDEPAVLRRRRGAARGLPLRLGLHPAFRAHALLHVRVRVRTSREPRAVCEVPRGRRHVRRPVPRLPLDRRRGLAPGATRRHRPRHLARRLLGRRVRRDRAADRDGRGDRADGVVERRALDAALMRVDPKTVEPEPASTSHEAASSTMPRPLQLSEG